MNVRLLTLIKGSRAPHRTIRSTLTLANAAWLSVIAALGLSLLGIYAIDLVGRPTAGGAFDLAPLAWKQVVFLILGLLAAVIVALPHYRILSLAAWPATVVVLGLLVFLLAPGVPKWLVSPTNGARAWINLGPVNLQPAELAKIVFVLVVARYMRFRRTHREVRGLIVPGIIAFVPMALITLQPDLGSASLFVPSLFAMLVAAGARLRHVGVIMLAGLLAAPASWPLLRPYQKERFIALVHQVQGDRSREQDINFQSFTAQRLVGAGGLAGNSDARTRALVRFNRLPEAHNDMVFAVVVNRFGALGGVAVFGVYLLWLGGALLTAVLCREPVGRMLCVGLAAFVAVQMVINVGMTIGLLPIIGITLPFISYGGSSMLASWIMTGLILNVALRRPMPPFRPSFEYGDDDA
ncbi:MAG: FtsW/RodA/SpoVE family cell cycle protein [Phycisphaerales bacterium]|nr:FtsW/RodA/SpoVE family cell cycle protein [Phycisphaerales bacterium]